MPSLSREPALESPKKRRRRAVSPRLSSPLPSHLGRRRSAHRSLPFPSETPGQAPELTRSRWYSIRISGESLHHLHHQKPGRSRSLELDCGDPTDIQCHRGAAEAAANPPRSLPRNHFLPAAPYPSVDGYIRDKRNPL